MFVTTSHQAFIQGHKSKKKISGAHRSLLPLVDVFGNYVSILIRMTSAIANIESDAITRFSGFARVSPPEVRVSLWNEHK